MFIILEREAVSQQQFIVRLRAVVIEDFRLRLDAVGTSRERYRFPIAAPLDFCTLAVVEQIKEWQEKPGAPVVGAAASRSRGGNRRDR